MKSNINETNHVVVDIETLGTRPGCVILQIGAADILQCQPPFSATLQIQPQLEAGLYKDENTLIWWEKQKSDKNKQAWAEEYHPATALKLFGEYLKEIQLCGPPLEGVWGNSSIFDLGILAYTHSAFNLPVPWNYKQEFCLRTLKFLIAPDEYIEGITHTADEDACAEAEWLKNALSKLKTIMAK